MRGSVPAMGRITGSASIETLVRVGIEKEPTIALVAVKKLKTLR